MAGGEPRCTLRWRRQFGDGHLPRRRRLSRAVARPHRVPAESLLPHRSVLSALRRHGSAAGAEVLSAQRRPCARDEANPTMSAEEFDYVVEWWSIPAARIARRIAIYRPFSSPFP